MPTENKHTRRLHILQKVTSSNFTSIYLYIYFLKHFFTAVLFFCLHLIRQIFEHTLGGSSSRTCGWWTENVRFVILSRSLPNKRRSKAELVVPGSDSDERVDPEPGWLHFVSTLEDPYCRNHPTDAPNGVQLDSNRRRYRVRVVCRYVTCPHHILLIPISSWVRTGPDPDRVRVREFYGHAVRLNCHISATGSAL